MGTANFLTLNAKKEYSITLEDQFYDEHEVDKDYENELPFEYELKYITENYKSQLRELGYEYCEDYTDDNRNFPGQFAGVKYICIGNSDESKMAQIIIKPLYRYGYYDGINFDYDYLIELSGSELPYGYILNELGILYGVPKGYKGMVDKANRILAQESKKLELLFSKITDSYK